MRRVCGRCGPGRMGWRWVVGSRVRRRIFPPSSRFRLRSRCRVDPELPWAKQSIFASEIDCFRLAGGMMDRREFLCGTAAVALTASRSAMGTPEIPVAVALPKTDFRLMPENFTGQSYESGQLYNTEV